MVLAVQWDAATHFFIVISRALVNEVLELSSFMKRVSNDSAENKDLQVALWRLLTCYKKNQSWAFALIQRCGKFSDKP